MNNNPRNSKLTIAIVTFNNEDTIRQTLNSIKNSTIPAKRIIIVDNGSTDKSIEKIKKIKKIKVFKNNKNLGFAKAVNQGIKKSSGKYLLITNNDVVFKKDYLSVLVEYLQKNPKTGMVGGKIYYRQPK